MGNKLLFENITVKLSTSSFSIYVSSSYYDIEFVRILVASKQCDHKVFVVDSIFVSISLAMLDSHS